MLLLQAFGDKFAACKPIRLRKIEEKTSFIPDDHRRLIATWLTAIFVARDGGFRPYHVRVIFLRPSQQIWGMQFF